MQPSRQQRKGRWRTPVGSPTVALLNAMDPLLSGWSPSGCTGVASDVCTARDTCRYARAQRDMKRRHPTKSGWWRTEKYWGRTSGARQACWVCQDQARHATLRKCAWPRMVRHRRVPQTYAPEAPTRQDDGRPRSTSPRAPTDRQGRLARRQHGRCPGGHQALDHGAVLHLHHVGPKHQGGTDDPAHLGLVHANGQRQLHRSSAPLGVRRWLEPWTR